MRTIVTNNVYALELTEHEWYLATEQEQEAWRVTCKREAAEANCQYVSIFVQPDTFFSVSPNPKRHKVWGHTFETDSEIEFRADMLQAYGNAMGKLSLERMRAIAKEILGC